VIALVIAIACIFVGLNKKDEINEKRLPAPCHDAILGEEGECSYTVHIIPHSHNDVGWLKTVQQYYDGTNPSAQRANVHEIIDSYMGNLLKDKDRTFS